MADQANNAPAADAAQAMGGMMMGETSPFPSDSGLPDHSDDIASIFGLGEEAGPVPNSPESGSDGGASPAASTPAAEGGGEQVPSPTTPPTPPSAQPGQQGEPSQAPAPAQTPPAAPPAAPEPTQPQTPATSTAALEAQVQALIAQNAQLLAQMQSQGAAPQPQTGPNGQQGADDPDPNMDYRFAIPDDVASAIFNEDANIARNGMAHLINSMGRVIHERVLKSVQERVLPRELSNFQQQSQLTSQQESMRQDYFKAYPQHNDPGIRLIVAQEAQTMWTLNPTQEWNEDARNALGARVNARLGAAPLQQQQGGLPSVAQAQPIPQPAPMLGSSNRPPVPEGTGGDFISEVLSA
jgi:hypothetical protein